MEHQFDRDAERLETVVKLAHAPLETREALIAEYQKRSEAAFAKESPAAGRGYRRRGLAVHSTKTRNHFL